MSSKLDYYKPTICETDKDKLHSDCEWKKKNKIQKAQKSTWLQPQIIVFSRNAWREFGSLQRILLVVKLIRIYWMRVENWKFKFSFASKNV